MPSELEYALVIDGLAQRYGKLPREIEEEEIGLLRMVRLVQMGTPDASS